MNLSREQQALLDWFLRAHHGSATAPAMTLERSNLGLAVSLTWRETVWAWLWLELVVPEYAVGWPEGSLRLTYPRTSRRFAEYVALEPTSAAA